jgi:hypothetical protein
MNRWALLAVAGFLGCAVCSSAQVDLTLNPSGPSVTTNRGFNLNTLSGVRYGYPTLTLLDGDSLSLTTAYTSIDPVVDFLPPMSADNAKTVRSVERTNAISDDKVLHVRKNFEVHGEVGVLYGHSLDGRVSRELEQGYIFGEIGNDKTQISVGAFYQHLNDHGSRH